MSAIDLVGHLAFGLGALAFVMRDMLWLRLVGIASGLVGLAYNWIVPGGPLWPPLLWGGAYVAIHAWRAIELVAERLPQPLNDVERAIRTHLAPDLPLAAVRRLARHAERRVLSGGERIGRAGATVTTFALVTGGSLRVEEPGLSPAWLGAGATIGEAALLDGSTFVADLIVEDRLTIVAWDVDMLRRLVAREPAIAAALDHAYLNRLSPAAQARAPRQGGCVVSDHVAARAETA